MINNDLTGKVALVTGGSQGIGRGIANVLAQNGADVIFNYHSDDGAAAETVEHLLGLGVKATAMKADVGNYDEVDKLSMPLLQDMLEQK
ncbi:MAG: SDR family NAD(P)-dependent oxidoreductase [Bacillota bacterium]